MYSAQVGCGLSNGPQVLEYFSLAAPQLEIPLLLSPVVVTALMLAR